jgi:hypothetical protein
MVIIKNITHLDNLMFQYVYTKALEQKSYNVKINILAFEAYMLHGKSWLYKKILKNIYIKRYMQNELYFKYIRKILFKFFINIIESYIKMSYKITKYYITLKVNKINKKD